jgi:hypothetical protein
MLTETWDRLFPPAPVAGATVRGRSAKPQAEAGELPVKSQVALGLKPQI